MSHLCKVEKCEKEVFSNDACIFHCDKKDWYEQENKTKRWNTNLLETFWEAFTTHIIAKI